MNDGFGIALHGYIYDFVWSNGVSVSHLVVLLGDNKVLLRAYS